jgi:hypothetical protein
VRPPHGRHAPWSRLRPGTAGSLPSSWLTLLLLWAGRDQHEGAPCRSGAISAAAKVVLQPPIADAHPCSLDGRRRSGLPAPARSAQPFPYSRRSGASGLAHGQNPPRVTPLPWYSPEQVEFAQVILGIDSTERVPYRYAYSAERLSDNEGAPVSFANLLRRFGPTHVSPAGARWWSRSRPGAAS